MTTVQPLRAATPSHQCMALAVPGALYREGVLEASECIRLYEQIDSSSGLGQERAQDYGYRPGGGGIEYIGPLPDWLAGVARRLSDDCGGVPAQCTVEKVPPGKGTHRRAEVEVKGYGPVVAILSLGALLVRFELIGEVGGKHRHEVLLAPGSLLLLGGDARYRWTHKLVAQRKDRLQESPVDTWQVSLTFRTVDA